MSRASCLHPSCRERCADTNGNQTSHFGLGIVAPEAEERPPLPRRLSASSDNRLTLLERGPASQSQKVSVSLLFWCSAPTLLLGFLLIESLRLLRRARCLTMELQRLLQALHSIVRVGRGGQWQCFWLHTHPEELASRIDPVPGCIVQGGDQALQTGALIRGRARLLIHLQGRVLLLQRPVDMHDRATASRAGARLSGNRGPGPVEFLKRGGASVLLSKLVGGLTLGEMTSQEIFALRPNGPPIEEDRRKKRVLLTQAQQFASHPCPGGGSKGGIRMDDLRFIMGLVRLMRLDRLSIGI